MNTLNISGNREIVFEVIGENAEAFHNKKRVSYVWTTGFIENDFPIPDDQPQITGWETEPGYRREGIALALVQALYDEFGVLMPAQKNIGFGGVNALTDDGLGITRRCQELGLIAPFPDERPDPDYYDDQDS